MAVFQLLQVLDPSIVHGTMRRQCIGTKDLAAATAELLCVFEVPLHTSLASKYSIMMDIKNAFTTFRSSEICAEMWQEHTKRYERLPFDHTVVYAYYKTLLEMPDIAPWAFACLFLLIFPTGNACAESGFSAMNATHTKERQEMSHEQVWAHLAVRYSIMDQMRKRMPKSLTLRVVCQIGVRIWVLRVNNPVRYSSTGQACNGTTVSLPW
jgi:hypothetical protein